MTAVRVDGEDAVNWLRQRSDDSDGNGVVTGWDATGWAASTWILHAMYERRSPSEHTHDDEYHASHPGGPATGDDRLDELLRGATIIGGAVGLSEHPGTGYSRLTWARLADRLSVSLTGRARFPGSRVFPYRSWPASIEPPGEGSLDREQFVRLTTHLADISPDGWATDCLSFWAQAVHNRFDEILVERSALADVRQLPDRDDVIATPSNLWPVDRQWLVWTDWDLWGTKVSGPSALMDRLATDDELETVAWPEE